MQPQQQQQAAFNGSQPQQQPKYQNEEEEEEEADPVGLEAGNRAAQKRGGSLHFVVQSSSPGGGEQSASTKNRVSVTTRQGERDSTPNTHVQHGPPPGSQSIQRINNNVQSANTPVAQEFIPNEPTPAEQVTSSFSTTTTTSSSTIPASSYYLPSQTVPNTMAEAAQRQPQHQQQFSSGQQVPPHSMTTSTGLVSKWQVPPENSTTSKTSSSSIQQPHGHQTGGGSGSGGQYPPNFQTNQSDQGGYYPSVHVVTQYQPAPAPNSQPLIQGSNPTGQWQNHPQGEAAGNYYHQGQQPTGGPGTPNYQQPYGDYPNQVANNSNFAPQQQQPQFQQNQVGVPAQVQNQPIVSHQLSQRSSTPTSVQSPLSPTSARKPLVRQTSNPGGAVKSKADHWVQQNSSTAQGIAKGAPWPVKTTRTKVLATARQEGKELDSQSMKPIHVLTSPQEGTPPMAIDDGHDETKPVLQAPVYSQQGGGLMSPTQKSPSGAIASLANGSPMKVTNSAPVSPHHQQRPDQLPVSNNEYPSGQQERHLIMQGPWMQLPTQQQQTVRQVPIQMQQQQQQLQQLQQQVQHRSQQPNEQQQVHYQQAAGQQIPHSQQVPAQNQQAADQQPLAYPPAQPYQTPSQEQNSWTLLKSVKPPAPQNIQPPSPTAPWAKREWKAVHSPRSDNPPAHPGFANENLQPQYQQQQSFEPTQAQQNQQVPQHQQPQPTQAHDQHQGMHMQQQQHQHQQPKMNQQTSQLQPHVPQHYQPQPVQAQPQGMHVQIQQHHHQPQMNQQLTQQHQPPHAQQNYPVQQQVQAQQHPNRNHQQPPQYNPQLQHAQPSQPQQLQQVHMQPQPLQQPHTLPQNLHQQNQQNIRPPTNLNLQPAQHHSQSQQQPTQQQAHFQDQNPQPQQQHHPQAQQPQRQPQQHQHQQQQPPTHQAQPVQQAHQITTQAPKTSHDDLSLASGAGDTFTTPPTSPTHKQKPVWPPLQQQQLTQASANPGRRQSASKAGPGGPVFTNWAVTNKTPPSTPSSSQPPSIFGQQPESHPMQQPFVKEASPPKGPPPPTLPKPKRPAQTPEQAQPPPMQWPPGAQEAPLPVEQPLSIQTQQYQQQQHLQPTQQPNWRRPPPKTVDFAVNDEPQTTAWSLEKPQRQEIKSALENVIRAPSSSGHKARPMSRQDEDGNHLGVQKEHDSRSISAPPPQDRNNQDGEHLLKPSAIKASQPKLSPEQLKSMEGLTIPKMIKGLTKRTETHGIIRTPKERFETISADLVNQYAAAWNDAEAVGDTEVIRCGLPEHKRPTEAENDTNVEKCIERLRENDPTMVEINLNNMKRTPIPQLQRMIATLKGNAHLKKLSLANLGLSDNAMEILLETLEVNTTLEFLNIETNFLTGNFLVRLFNSALVQQTLREVKAVNQSATFSNVHEQEMMKAIYKNRALVKCSLNLRLTETRSKVEKALIRNGELRRLQRKLEAEGWDFQDYLKSLSKQDEEQQQAMGGEQ